MPRTAALAMLLPWLARALPAAQLCSGEPSFAGAPVHLVADASFNQDVEVYGAGLAVGGAGVFGGAEVGVTTYNALPAESFDVTAGAGYQVPVGGGGRAQLCPGVALGFASGPKNIAGSGIDYSEVDLAASLDAGYVAVRSNVVLLIPTASLALANATGKLSDSSGNSTSQGDTFAVLAVGVGVVFGGDVSVKPSLTFPLGLQGGSTAFAVHFAIKLAGGH